MYSMCSGTCPQSGHLLVHLEVTLTSPNLKGNGYGRTMGKLVYIYIEPVVPALILNHSIYTVTEPGDSALP